MRDMTIGRAAQQAGVNVETIRFYERRGLVEKPAKGEKYRVYPPEMVARVRFIRRAQQVGFSLREVQELLLLRADPNADCADVKQQAQHKIEEVDRKISELGRVRAALQKVVESCPGRGRLTACTILNVLEDAPQPWPQAAASPRFDDEEENTMKSVTLKVEGMRCDGCAETLRSLVSAQPGTRAADVSFEEGQARVFYDPRTISEEDLVTTIQKAGFRVVSP